MRAIRLIEPATGPYDERVRYVARPGLRALPAGSAAALGFAVPQLIVLAFFLWVLWSPEASTGRNLAFSLSMTVALLAVGAGVIWLLVRRNLPLLLGIVRAPFIRLTVTDRRVLWSLPWTPEPLMEIEAARIRGGIVGELDAQGRGNAVILLNPGDYAGDFDGNIHLDRLPDAAAFVDALRLLA
ncbi:hypothetical protein CLG96_10385 [Sphingomonas oleivorans]|uniref:Uncharacterized protein n=1 Tax=Sphingomonas oleivorans TaxID=1735121 RepID=A0A2T5FXD9_9SPHN|nr:hypothetical protein [Sphingomonas oleivorans]PTQ10800.1 hypothetical protein CLG96_10385 [Sphingomonas oleivorans]